MSAKRRISSSSLRRCAENSVDWVMAFPRWLLFAFLPSRDGEQILGDHAPTHIALESTLSFIQGTSPGEGMFQVADGSFDAGAPAQGTAEPALFLVLGPFARQAPARRQSPLLHAQLFRFTLVLSRKETSVGGRHLWCSPKAGLMLLQRRDKTGAIVRVALQHLVSAYDAILHFVQPH